MRPSLSVLFVLVAIWLIAVPIATSGQEQHPNPTAEGLPEHRRPGFFDYALGKVNPENKDYGVQVRSVRDDLVQHSVDDLYFWSNAFTLALLIAVTSLLLFHWRAADKKEAICASLIAQLWNGRVSDRIEIERRTEQYNRLVESHNGDVERILMDQPQSLGAENQVGSKLQRTVEELAERRVSARRIDGNARPDSAAPVVNAAVKPPTEAAFGPEQQNLLLQRRIEAMKNTEENLKERLNRTTLLLEQERNRNQTLKGA